MTEFLSALLIVAGVLAIAMMTLRTAHDGAPRRVGTHHDFDSRTPPL
ncbi:hypothetical protein CLV56_0727 [Mumia flava]|uniref:Uncharacterized protein n=1 Tax=Mumia flava TaxID=1348852 RepID=A0A2M9BEZ7_9ACTN|nr:hypothetical protein [Mumia flava]PJJ56518.1 hypothetical protein CLV56_0727 [Mumia flava]